MFHTNTTKTEERYQCDEGCERNGDCPGHKMELIINNTVGVAELKIDEEVIHWFDCNEADALYKLFKQLKNE